MKKELDYFIIGNSYGGNQRWMRSIKMRVGGCGAITACDCSILFAKNQNVSGVCPFDPARVTREEYVSFCHRMENYLWPRRHGIDRIEIYLEGYANYLRDAGVTGITMTGLHGEAPYEAARAAVTAKIDHGLPLPMLLLRHKDRQFQSYNWHWFPIIGYEETGEGFHVKVATYSHWQWFDLRALWDTGHGKKGGLILYELG